MFLRYSVLILFLSAFPLESFAQAPEANSFSGGPPLWNTQNLSGNFGELRSNHFHSGIDYKTNELEGFPVMAADNGYISRVKISSGGYGKAIYMTHPGGVVTVYAHLRRFYHVLQDSVRKLQDSRQQYEIEFFPKSGEFPVSKGELIGYSGNTGSSSGPHLHFETRHEGSELPFNPVAAGYQINDTISPVISSMIIYEPGPYGGLFGSSRHLLEKDGVKKGALKRDSVLVAGSFFVGVEAHDLAGDEPNRLGIRAGRLFLDDTLVFSFSIDSFSFSQTRMVHAFLDYGFYSETGREVMLFYVMPGNKLPVYRKSKGIFHAREKTYSHLRIELEDASGNISGTGCFVGRSTKQPEAATPAKAVFLPGKSSTMKLKHAKVEMQPASFFEPVDVAVTEIMESPAGIKCFSPGVKFSPGDLPVNESIAVSLKCSIKGNHDRSKLAVARVASGKRNFVAGTLKKKTMHFKVRTMGHYVVSWDTVPPRCTTPRWEHDTFTGTGKLFVPVEEDFTGVKSYSCFINETWVPAAFNSLRSGLVIYPEDFPENAVPGKIRVLLEDEVANSSVSEFPVIPHHISD